MRIVVFSDPHADINTQFLIDNNMKEKCTEILVNTLDSNRPDVLICAGDVTPETNLQITVLTSIREETESDFYLFVPRNHDIWFKKPANHSGKASSSLDKYQRLIPKICQEIGFTFLLGNPLAINKVGFLGSIGWYDYSFRNTK